jgi:hypothetical protein
MQRGRNVAPKRRKKHDVLPVQVRAMGFRVQACILRSLAVVLGLRGRNIKNARRKRSTGMYRVPFLAGDTHRWSMYLVLPALSELETF